MESNNSYVFKASTAILYRNKLRNQGVFEPDEYLQHMLTMSDGGTKTRLELRISPTELLEWSKECLVDDYSSFACQGLLALMEELTDVVFDVKSEAMEVWKDLCTFIDGRILDSQCPCLLKTAVLHPLRTLATYCHQLSGGAHIPVTYRECGWCLFQKGSVSSLLETLFLLKAGGEHGLPRLPIPQTHPKASGSEQNRFTYRGPEPAYATQFTSAGYSPWVTCTTMRCIDSEICLTIDGELEDPKTGSEMVRDVDGSLMKAAESYMAACSSLYPGNSVKKNLERFFQPRVMNRFFPHLNEVSPSPFMDNLQRVIKDATKQDAAPIAIPTPS